MTGPMRSPLRPLVSPRASVSSPTGCSRPFVSPLAEPPYRNQAPASYDETWRALVRALQSENVPLRTVAKDSGVIASDDFVSPIGVYADCGRLGDERIEGEALVAFTVFVQPGGDGATDIQINAKMRTQAYPARVVRQAQVRPGLPVRVDRPLRGQPGRHRAPAREAVAMPPRLPELIKRARRLALDRDRLIQELARDWIAALKGQGFSPRRPRRALGGPDRGSGAAPREGIGAERRRRFGAKPTRSSPASRSAWRASLPPAASERRPRAAAPALPSVDALLVVARGRARQLRDIPRRRLTDAVREVLAAERRRVLETGGAPSADRRARRARRRTARARRRLLARARSSTRPASCCTPISAARSCPRWRASACS